jgi:hypothetical protein
VSAGSGDFTPHYLIANMRGPNARTWLKIIHKLYMSLT